MELLINYLVHSDLSKISLWMPVYTLLVLQVVLISYSHSSQYLPSFKQVDQLNVQVTDTLSNILILGHIYTL